MRLYYISGNVAPIYRIYRINEIKRLLSSKSRPWVVVVSTQCIEAGVDIDMDEIVRDFAPWDSLMQICGRANRFGFKGRATSGYIDGKTIAERNFIAISMILFSLLRLDILEGCTNVKEEEYRDIQKQYTEELKKRLQKEQDLMYYALSWQFNEFDFSKLFREEDAWKTSLFCIANRTAKELLDIAISLWKDKKPIEALEHLRKLCDRIQVKQIKALVEELQKKGEREIRYQLPHLLGPMLQAYTISIPKRYLEKLKVGQISNSFLYVPAEYYDPLYGFSFKR